VSARFPHRMAAAASLYGVRIVTDQEDSPHLLLDKVKGELYYAFAEVDHSVPEHVIPDLRNAVEKAGCNATIEIYPGTQPRAQSMTGARHKRKIRSRSSILTHPVIRVAVVTSQSTYPQLEPIERCTTYTELANDAMVRAFRVLALCVAIAGVDGHGQARRCGSDERGTHDTWQCVARIPNGDLVARLNALRRCQRAKTGQSQTCRMCSAEMTERTPDHCYGPRHTALQTIE